MAPNAKSRNTKFSFHLTHTLDNKKVILSGPASRGSAPTRDFLGTSFLLKRLYLNGINVPFLSFCQLIEDLQFHISLWVIKTANGRSTRCFKVRLFTFYEIDCLNFCYSTVDTNINRGQESVTLKSLTTTLVLIQIRGRLVVELLNVTVNVTECKRDMESIIA